MERIKYAYWRLRFYWRIRSVTGSALCARAELALWDFKATDKFNNWREADPVGAADEALSYY